MSAALPLALTLLLVGVPDEAEREEPEPVRVAAPEDDAFDAERDTVGPERAKAGKPLEGRLIESLLRVDDLAIRIESDLLPGERRDEIEAVVDLTAAISHDFDSPVRDLELGVALLSAPELEFAWGRLHTPPLRLTTEEVERKLTYPLAVMTVPGDDEPLAKATPREVSLRESFDALAIPHDGATQYLVAFSGYMLDAPSERDILRILADGGPADLAALARWAAATAATPDTEVALTDDARGRVMDALEAEIHRLRAPPAFGDFQRLNAITAVALVCARPVDLDRVLALQRPMTLLLSAAQVSYDAAAGEENILGVSVHGFRRLQSRSDSAVAWESTLARLRSAALDRLVRLAFDPIDFRDAPAHLRQRSVLNVQAAQLLEPLTTTSVERVLALVSDRPEMQRELLRFYVEVRYAAAVEPLVEWLVNNPRYLDDLGMSAVGEIGDRMLPVLMRRLDDPNATMTERTATWRLLAALPERHAAQLAELSRAMGVEMSSAADGAAPSVATLLEGVREYDERVQRDRIEDLVHEVATVATGVPGLRAQLRAAARLAEAAPARAQSAADPIIALHVAAARALDGESPGERRAALRQLVGLPLGPRHADAERAAALVDAELAAARGEVDAALDMLVDFDPALEHTDARALYLEIANRRWDELVAAKAWDGADALLARAEATVPEEFDVETRAAELHERRQAPLRIVGMVVGAMLAIVLLVALQVLGVFAAIGKKLHARWTAMRERGREREREHERDSDQDRDRDRDRDRDPDQDLDQDDEHEDDREDDQPRGSGDAVAGDPATVVVGGAAPELRGDAGASDPLNGELLGDSWSDADPQRSPLDDFAA